MVGRWLVVGRPPTDHFFTVQLVHDYPHTHYFHISVSLSFTRSVSVEITFISVSPFHLPDHSLWKATAVSNIAACGLGVCYLLNALSKLSPESSVNPLKHEEGRQVALYLLPKSYFPKEFGE